MLQKRLHLQWKNLFKQFETKTRVCKVCFKAINENSLYSLINSNSQICSTCYSKFEPIYEDFNIAGCDGLAIYKYNEGIRELIYQFKGCYDYELAPIFLNRCLNYLKFKYRGYVIVPAPSSKEGDEARGFNHVVEIFKYLDKPIIRNIEKTSDIKQADLSKSERKQISNYLEIKNRYLLTGKNVLIVDDVKTTGSTLKAMVKLIKECKPKKIKILVLSRRREDEKL